VTGSSSCNNCPTQTTGVPPAPDPLASLTPPTNPGGCTSQSVANNATLSLAPGCYSGITVGNNATLLLTGGPGVYYITGQILTGNSGKICLNVGCTFDYSAGVLIYLTGAGQITIPNGIDMTLNAMTSGPYTGILFYQDPTDTNAATIRNGSGTLNLSGAMYFPTASLEIGNAGNSNDCSLIVANSLSLGNGNSTFANTCSQYGGSPILTVTIAE
jgi:hypothetical protein